MAMGAAIPALACCLYMYLILAYSLLLGIIV